MNNQNYINLSVQHRDGYVYRIVSTERLFELFESGQNILVRPKLWDDPFENFILNSPIRLSNGEMGSFGFHDDFYGQCWTLQTASDAMWRIYSPDTRGVRIRTTVRRLAESLSRTLNQSAHFQCFIGKVQYLSKPKMAQFANTVLASGLDPASLASTLLVKRPAFKHEREVRLLYFKKENTKGSDLFGYKIDLSCFIDQIMIDPRLSRKEFESLKVEIKERTGFPGPIKRSLLYAPPQPIVIPVGQ